MMKRMVEYKRAQFCGVCIFWEHHYDDDDALTTYQVCLGTLLTVENPSCRL